MGQKEIIDRDTYRKIKKMNREELIMEKTPRFHRAVRSFYDKHGYPVSKHITTRTRADVVYFVMKPLEWLFILFLYTFDTHPENRIAVQYSDYCKK